MYLKIALEEFKEDNDCQAFLLAIRNVAEAQGGIAKLAQKTKLNRQNLYKALSKKGNPGFNTIMNILQALGFRLAIK
jgi:probable addiction module antidote protein